MTIPRPPVTPLMPNQTSPVTAPIGPVLIQGDAGTGKTHTLAARIAVWLKRGDDPTGIVCLTLSTGGPDVILKKIRDFLPPDVIPWGVFAGTPEQLSLKLLRMRGMEVLGRSPHFTVWQRNDAIGIISGLLDGNPRNLGTRRAEAGRILRWLWLDQAGFPDEHITSNKPEWSGLAEIYRNEKFRQVAVDLGDLIPLVNAALERDRTFGDMARHLLIDDFQDLIPAAYRMATLLAGPERSLTITLNPNEALHRDQGARDRVLQFFKLEHPVQRRGGTTPWDWTCAPLKPWAG